MDMIKEIVESQEVVAKNTEDQVKQLSDLQLTLIGGGIGDVFWG
jgi:hypothetical protein